MKFQCSFLLSCVCILGTFAANAENADLFKVLHLAPKIENAPVIDGRLSGKCWNVSPSFRCDNFEVRLLWDEQGLYIGIKNPIQKTSQELTEDLNGIWVFPSMNAQNYYKFSISSQGKYSEWYRKDLNFREYDWKSMDVRHAVKKGTDEWNAELFLGWKTLNLNVKENGSFGIMVSRESATTKERTSISTTGGKQDHEKVGFIFCVNKNNKETQTRIINDLLKQSSAPMIVNCGNVHNFIYVSSKNPMQTIIKRSELRKHFRQQTEAAVESAKDIALKKKLQEAELQTDFEKQINQYHDIQKEAEKKVEEMKLFHLISAEQGEKI